MPDAAILTSETVREEAVLDATTLDEAVVGPARAAAVAALARTPRGRRERLSGLHNPFARAARGIDAWALLALAECAALVEAVARAIGPDVVLWDTELAPDAEAVREITAGEERLWPVEPLAGALALVDLDGRGGTARVAGVPLAAPVAPPAGAVGPWLVLRYFPATSRFVREPSHPANRLGAEALPLVNYARRALWLVRGEDRAGNDYVTGFAAPTPMWAGAARPGGGGAPLETLSRERR